MAGRHSAAEGEKRGYDELSQLTVRRFMDTENRPMSHRRQNKTSTAVLFCRVPDSVLMRSARFVGAFIAMLLVTSCGDTQSAANTVHFRIIQQMTAYLEDGGVTYHDFVAHSGTAAYSDGEASFSLNHTAGPENIQLSLQVADDEVVIVIDGIETRGMLGSWIRVRKPGSDTFGSNTDCEIWVGPGIPPVH